MTAIWVYTVEVKGERDAKNMPDVTDYDVSARDGDIGKIETVLQDGGGSTCLVVDTGFWIFEKKRMIPAGVVDSIDHDNRRVNVTMTKDQIKKAPDYDEAHRDDVDVRDAHEKHYGKFAN